MNALHRIPLAQPGEGAQITKASHIRVSLSRVKPPRGPAFLVGLVEVLPV